MTLRTLAAGLVCTALAFGTVACEPEQPPAQVRPWVEDAVSGAEPPKGAAATSGNAVTSADWGGGAELLGVSLGAEGGFIMVSFKMPPAKAQGIFQGHASVKDEAAGTVYNEIAVMPVVGPLVARPMEEGQQGYVMLVNAPKPLKKGAVVTVLLGEYRQEHVLVQ